MKKLILKLGLFNCLYITTFILLSGIMFIVTMHSANTVINRGVNANMAFYWLSPHFFAIVGENLMLLISGILSCVGGSVVPISKEGGSAISLVKAIYRLVLLNIIALISSLLLLLCMELIIVPLRGNIDVSIVFHSSEIFLAMMMFLTFWSLIGLGLRITLNSVALSLAIGICIQLAEVFVIYRYVPQIEIYLPTALSRNLVVSQFPFWILGSWANVEGAVIFANSPMLVNKYYQNVALGAYWVPIMLAYYVAIVFILPTVRIILGQHTKHYDNN
ncbi:hypothetical protein [Desulfosporosinus fructosivorans]